MADSVVYKVSVPLTPHVLRYYPEKGAAAEFLTFPGLSMEWLEKHSTVTGIPDLRTVADLSLLSSIAGTLRNKRGKREALTVSDGAAKVAAVMKSARFEFSPMDLPTVSLSVVRAKAESAGLAGLTDEQVRSLAQTFYPGSIVTD